MYQTLTLFFTNTQKDYTGCLEELKITVKLCHLVIESNKEKYLQNIGWKAWK